MIVERITIEAAGAELVHGDALFGLGLLEDGSVDALITDPPYCSGAFQEAAKKSAKCQGVDDDAKAFRWFSGDNVGSAALAFLLRAVAVNAARLLKDGGSAIFFCDWRMVATLAPAIESSGLRHTSTIVWDKGSGGMGWGFRPQHETALHFTKGTGKYWCHDGSNVITCARTKTAGKEHPTEKPLPLLLELVRVVSPEGGLVVDPFAGSGSTLCAAARLKRRSFGVERERDFIEVARRRLDEPVIARPVQLSIEGVS